ncbi:MAG: hypothetical protein ACOC16_02575 [Nanoarchaeota archaeon]
MIQQQLEDFIEKSNYKKNAGHIEGRCFWKELEQDPSSSTFLDVRESGEKHPLYQCIDCLGHTNVCSYYRLDYKYKN